MDKDQYKRLQVIAASSIVGGDLSAVLEEFERLTKALEVAEEALNKLEHWNVVVIKTALNEIKEIKEGIS